MNRIATNEVKDKKFHLKESKNQNFGAIIKRNKLFVDNKTFTLNELKDLSRGNALEIARQKILPLLPVNLHHETAFGPT